MKRILFALTVVLLAVCVAGCGKITEARQRRPFIQSASNLKQIGLACKTYAIDFKGNFPDDFTTLVKKEYLTDTTTYIAPLDSRRKASKDKAILPANTSYVYVGKGLSENDNADLPLAFEKPDVVSELGGDLKGRCNVLYIGGFVSNVKVKGQTCKAIAQELTAGAASSDAKQVAIILANAEAADEAK